MLQSPVCSAPSAISSRGRRASEGGYALILTLMILLLLMAILYPLTFEVQRELQVSSNTRAMRHLELAGRRTLREALDVLAEDFPSDEGGGLGGLGGLGNMGSVSAESAATAPGGGEGEEEEADPPHDSLNSQSLAYHRRTLKKEENSGQDEDIPNWVIAPSANSEGYERDDIRVKSFVYIEDENRKYNVLSLAHPDDEVAEQALQQVEKLLEWVREDRLDAGLDGDFDPQQVARAFREWMTTDLYRSLDSDSYQRPLLLSNKRKGNENDASDKTTLPVSLDELRQAAGDRVDMPESIWVDLLDSEMPPEVHPGLSSLLTVYTALREEPITEDEDGRYIPDPDPEDGGMPRANTSRNTSGNTGAEVQPPQASEDAMPLININTAPQAVLLAVAETSEVPEFVINEILEYRVEIDEERKREKEEEQAESTQFDSSKSQTDVMTGMEGDEAEPLQVFMTLEEIAEKIPSFEALDEEARNAFLSHLTVQSDVFSIWVTVLCNPYESEEQRAMSMASSFGGEDNEELGHRYLDIKTGEIVRRYRSVVWRRASTEGEEPVEFVAIVPMEERRERKLALWEDPNKVAW